MAADDARVGARDALQLWGRFPGDATKAAVDALAKDIDDLELLSQTDESLMLTGDLNVAVVEWIVQYRIQDPIAYLFNVRDTRKTIRDITEAIMRRAVGNRLGSAVLTTGRVEILSPISRIAISA